MQTPEEHLATLRQFQAWRMDIDGSEGIKQPHPRDISEALEWAIAELARDENRSTSDAHGNDTSRAIPVTGRQKEV